MEVVAIVSENLLNSGRVLCLRVSASPLISRLVVLVVVVVAQYTWPLLWFRVFVVEFRLNQ